MFMQYIYDSKYKDKDDGVGNQTITFIIHDQPVSSFKYSKTHIMTQLENP